MRILLFEIMCAACLLQATSYYAQALPYVPYYSACDAARSTLDNPVFAVMELHRFELYINDGDDESGAHSHDGFMEEPDAFVDGFNAAYLVTPKAQSETALQRVASSSSAPVNAAQRQQPGKAQGAPKAQGKVKKL